MEGGLINLIALPKSGVAKGAHQLAKVLISFSKEATSLLSGSWQSKRGLQVPS